jgi:predicted HicB family RNase H-like nuclease
MTDAERYAISVRKVTVEDEDLWRATVRELPDVAEFSKTRETAIELALDTIASLKEDALAAAQPFPEPIEDEEEFSGRVTLRLPKSVHRAVVFQAEEEGVSLNSYVATCLTCSVSQRLRAAHAGASIPIGATPIGQTPFGSVVAGFGYSGAMTEFVQFDMTMPHVVAPGLVISNAAICGTGTYAHVAATPDPTSNILRAFVGSEKKVAAWQ